MELSEYRKEFDIHFLAPKIIGIEKSISQFENIGHKVQWGENQATFRIEFNANPAHIVVVHLLTLESTLEDFLIECLAVSPKCLFIVVGLPSQSSVIKTYFEYGVLAFVEMGESVADQLSWAIDLVLERSVYQIQNEVFLNEKEDLQIKLKSSRESCERVAGELVLYKNKEIETKAHYNSKANLIPIIKGAFAPQSKEEIVQNFLESIDQIDGLEVRGIFFKYLPQIQTLVATHCSGMDVERIKGIGIRLTTEQSKKSTIFLSENKSFFQLDELMLSGFLVSKYYLNHVQVRDELEGVFVFWAADQSFFNEKEFECRYQIFNLIFERFIYQRRAEELEVRDTVMRFIGIEEFNRVLNEEILRAKNSLSSVTIVKFSLDQLNSIESQYGEPVRDAVLKHIASVVKKVSKQSDTLCRTALNEFTMILPFTNYREAMIKAERLRRLVESTPLPTLSEELTLSLGMSEYPSLTYQADQLARGAIQAMTAVIERGGNKVGVARAPVGYKPEYMIKDISFEQEL